MPPAGTLTLAGHRDTFRLTCLCAAALVGTVPARIGQARAAYRRIAAEPATAPTDGDGGPLGSWVPVGSRPGGSAPDEITCEGGR